MVELYTDGSCKKVKGEWVYRIGWGFVAVENDIKLHESYGRLCGPLISWRKEMLLVK